MILIKNLFLKGATGSLSLVALLASCDNTIEKPNILFILADDLRADALGCYGNSIIRTPVIDNLSETGLRFSNSYIMGGHHGAISAPSRAMLLSGKYLFNVYDRLAGVSTMPACFGADGYMTFGTGKWHNEKSAFEASFQKGTSVFLGGMADHFNVPCNDMGDDGKLTTSVKNGFSTDIFTSAAIDFITSYSSGNREKPFFCYVAYTAPHDPYSPEEDFVGRYNPGSIPLPGNFLPLHPFAFDDLTVRDENLLSWPRSPELIKEVLSDYYGLITHLDERIGDLIETLKKNKLYRNTLIVFAADNGLAIGSHGLLGKQNLYEHSMKVPLIIAGPGIPKGKISDAFVYLFDIFPTLAEICSVNLPAEIDGMSLMPVITGKSEKIRASIFTAYRNSIRAVRTDEWKLIRYPARDFTQLFNLKKDPLELNNLAADSMYRSYYEMLIGELRTWQAEANDTLSLTAPEILPMEYDHTSLVRKPDKWQPDYTLKKYFERE